MLIVGAAARRSILAEARRVGVDPQSVARPDGDGALRIDWGDLVAAIERKKKS